MKKKLLLGILFIILIAVLSLGATWDLDDPDADSIIGWDETSNAVEWLTEGEVRAAINLEPGTDVPALNSAVPTGTWDGSGADWIFPLIIDFGGATSFEIPNKNDDPDDTGEILLDTTVSNFTNGAFRYYDGTNIRQVVDMIAATAEGCTDDYVAAYDAAADLWYCKADADAGGFASADIDATTWSDGGNASNVWTFALSGTNHTMTAASGEMQFSHKVTAASYVQGLVMTTLDTAATVDLLGNTGADGEVRINSDTDVIKYILPPAILGLSVCFYNRVADVISIDPDDGADYIVLNGTSIGVGDELDSPAEAGAFVCLLAVDGDEWVVMGQGGTWVDGGAS